jgi:hypothetical protein
MLLVRHNGSVKGSGGRQGGCLVPRTRRSGGEPALLPDGGRVAPAEPPQAVTYSLVAGIVSTAIGAAASLATIGLAQIAVWGTVSGTASVAAGLVRDSAPVSAGWAACRRWLSRLAGL